VILSRPGEKYIHSRLNHAFDWWWIGAAPLPLSPYLAHHTYGLAISRKMEPYTIYLELLWGYE
jgi:hypothetical protein